MSAHANPNIITDNLVFGYDTGYNINDRNLGVGRHFKGPISNNLLEVHNHSRSNTSGTNGFVLNGEETVNIPKIGKRSVKYVEYYNNYNNSGDLGCCPNLFYYHNGYITGVESSTSYTYSIIYKHTGDYTHPNFMYRYEYQTDGTYNTEGGIHSTASNRRRHLGNGWYHAWGTFTTQSTTTQLRCYSFLYNYGTTTHRFYVASISLIKNISGSTHLITPPRLILKPNTSVSSTQSLVDLKRTTTIDVSNVSFDSNAQMTFDGTDDIINTGLFSGRNPSTDPFTVEAMVKSDVTSGSRIWIDATTNGSSQRFYSALIDSTSHAIGIQGSAWSDPTPGDTDWHHQVIVMDGNTAKAYNNGELASSKSYTSYTLAGGLNVGGRSGYRWVGQIPIFRLYNRALTQDEVSRNYNAFKDRFGL